MGVHPYFSWYLIEIPTDKLVASIIGEVDILAGNIFPRDLKIFDDYLTEQRREHSTAHPTRLVQWAMNHFAWNREIQWPPILNHLIGIELKTSYLPLTADSPTRELIKSRKEGKTEDIQKSLGKLLDIGLNRVGLFEFIANPPSDGIGNEPWRNASALSGHSLEEMIPVYGSRLPAHSPVGHAACSISGINGRPERGSGSIATTIFNHAEDNPYLSEASVHLHRETLDHNLRRILSGLPFPYTLSAVYVYKKKDNISWINEGNFRC